MRPPSPPWTMWCPSHARPHPHAGKPVSQGHFVNVARALVSARLDASVSSPEFRSQFEPACSRARLCAGNHSAPNRDRQGAGETCNDLAALEHTLETCVGMSADAAGKSARATLRAAVLGLLRRVC